MRIKRKHVLRAVLIELVALVIFIPGCLGGMMRHSAAAPRSWDEELSNTAAYVLHLPTVVATYPFDALVLVTPITQVIFWTWLLTYFDRRKRPVKD